MNYQNNKKKLILLLFLPLQILFLINCAALADNIYVNITPKEINCGDTVAIEVNGITNSKNNFLTVTSPTGKAYHPEFVSKITQNEQKCFAAFSNTSDKGFLSQNWNKYLVRLFNRDGTLLCEDAFYLKQNNKELYFTIYIDDVGASGLPEPDGLRWFESNKYPVNLGWENGELNQEGILLDVIKNKYDLSSNYLFHHFHAINYTGNALLQKIDKAINWYQIHTKINSAMSNILGIKVYFRDRHFFLALIFILVASGLLSLKKRNILFATVTIFFCIVTTTFLIASFSAQYSYNEKNWTAHFDDPQWCKAFLIETKKDFMSQGLPYPRITRHGWNVPLKGLTEFYMKEMGVLADATVIYNTKFEFDKHNVIAKIKGPNAPSPYYSSISKGCEFEYNGLEIDRGILELPLIFDVSEYDPFGFIKKIEKDIETLPNGALVSTYCHPKDSLKKYIPLISFLKKNMTLSLFQRINI